MFKAHCKVEGILSLVPLPEIDELSAILNSSTVYSLSNFTSQYHYIELPPETQKKSALVTSMGKFELKK